MSKLIKAVFTGRFCRTQRVFQWDTDDKLQIVNVDLPTNYTVDFSNSKMGDSVSVLATSDTVQIPPDLFVPGSEIYAWIWLSDSNGGHTRCEATIPIDPRARRTGTEPTPAQASAWDEAVDTLNETIEGIPAVVDAALTEAKESGEFDGADGADGNGVWYVDVQYTRTTGAGAQAQLDHMVGRPGATPAAGDLCVVSDGRFGAVTIITPRVAVVPVLGDLSGADGYSPVVTITEIEGGHRITITDEAHPDGQSFDVLDGQGGSGSSDYNALDNKPQINSVTLTGNKSLSDLGIEPEAFVVTITNSGGSYSADKTYAQITAAASAGKRVVATIDNVYFSYYGLVSGADALFYNTKQLTNSFWSISSSNVLTHYTSTAGNYSKPVSGIPKTDLASDVQNSLSVVIDFEYVGLDSDGTTQILSTNVTPSEINSAYQAGRVVMARYADGEIILPLCSVGEGLTMVIFGAEFNGSEEMIWSEDLTDNTAWYYGSTYMLPAPLRPGHADDGKIQVANNGMWTAAQQTIPMGHLDAGSTATVMTATIPGITELRDGVCVWLENGVIASASGVTLNINSLGAKPIYNSLSGTVVTTTFVAASTYLFVYNSTRVTGGCWDMVYGYDTNTTYTPAKLGQGYAVCSTAAATVAKTASISNYTLVAGGIVAIKFENNVPAGASLNINSKGAKAIYYKGAAITAGVIKAGDTVTMIYSTYYHVLSIDRDVDTLPPSPSDENPFSVDINASPGTSTEYARADHVHAINSGAVEILLDEKIAPYSDMLVLPSGAADGNAVVLLASKPGNVFLDYEIMSAHKHIAYFLIPLVQNPQNFNDFQVVSDASVSKVYVTANGLGLQYNGIADGKLYSAEVVLPFDRKQGTGTLSVTNLALPSAQGVSF